MAFDSRLPAAYQEEGPDRDRAGFEDHLRDLRLCRASAPSWIVLPRDVWRRTVTLLKAEPPGRSGLLQPTRSSTVMSSNRIDDSAIEITDGQNWTLAGSPAYRHREDCAGTGRRRAGPGDRAELASSGAAHRHACLAEKPRLTALSRHLPVWLLQTVTARG